MTTKKYEYTIQGIKFRMKKLTIGASLKFDKAQEIDDPEEKFPLLMEAMFPKQETDKVNWKELDLEQWIVIQKDFFFINKSVLQRQINLVKDISATILDPSTKVSSAKNIG
jgi:hypothetical protein